MQCGINTTDTTEKGFQAICEGGEKNKGSWFGIWEIKKGEFEDF